MKNRKISTLLLTMVMAFTMIFPSSQVFANDEDVSINENEDIIYNVISNLSEDKQTSEIVLTITPKEDIEIESVVLPDGTIEENLNTTVTYFVQENGIYSFHVNYVNTLLEDSLEENQTKTIDYNVSDIEVIKVDTDEISTEIDKPEEESRSVVEIQSNVDVVELDLTKSFLRIFSDGYKLYPLGDSNNVLDRNPPLIPFTGEYVLTGNFKRVLHTGPDNGHGAQIDIVGGTEASPLNITFKDLTLYNDHANSDDPKEVIMIGGYGSGLDKYTELVSDDMKYEDTYVNLKLVGTNTINASYKGVGIGFYSQEGRNHATLKISAESTGTLDVTGGSYAPAIGWVMWDGNKGNGTLIIDGGTINAQGGWYGAGIGGVFKNSSGNIIINGGTVNATGGQNGPGIGTGHFDGDQGVLNITINDGNITATGGHRYGAGIGTGAGMALTIPGRNIPEIDITINGGFVKATGSSYSPGIGTGPMFGSEVKYPNKIRNIVVNGGDVTATGGEFASGIGAGASTTTVVTQYNTVESIQINGGTVRSSSIGGANGRGAAIGSSQANTKGTSHVGSIKITGGVVIADAMQTFYGSGIGSGYNGASLEILEISGNADVTSYSGAYGSALGRGYQTKTNINPAFPIVIKDNPTIKAYSVGDVYSEGFKDDNGNILDMKFITAIDQECITHVGSNIASYMLMGDFKQIPNENADQEVTITNMTTGAGTSVMLPVGYASFATTVSDGLHRVEMNGDRYAGDLVKRTEDNLVINMGGKEKTLHAYWMLQPKTIEYTVDFKYASTDNPGSAVIPTPVAVVEGGQVSEPVITVPTDWTFDGWYLDEACKQKFIFTTAVTGDMTLYGKWQKNAPVIPTPTATPTPPVPTVSPKPTPDTGRTCQDDGYPDGYYWSESAQACIIDKVIVVPTPKPTIKPTTVPTTQPTKVPTATPADENSVVAVEKSNEQKPTAATMVDSNATNQDGNDKMEIDAKGSWSLVTVLASLGTLILAIILIVIKKEEEELENDKAILYKRNKGMMWGAIVLSILSVVIVFLTQSFTQPMVWLDAYSLIMILIMIINSCLLYFGYQWKEAE